MQKVTKREIVLAILIGLVALLANLPDEVIEKVGVHREYLLLALGGVVFIGMLLFLRFGMFLIIAVLVVGANVPGELAEDLGISKWPLIGALVVLVVFSLLNHIRKTLPTGLEKNNSKEAQAALFYAVEQGNASFVQNLLGMKIDPNMRGPGGMTPLMIAARTNNSAMVDMLVRSGADVALFNDKGDSAVDLAISAGHAQLGDLLKTIRMMQMEKTAEKATD
jgi:hypothetical protein